MYQKGFRQILFGFLCVLIDIRFGGLDILLPDFVGYILVMRGLGMLSKVHFSFRRGWYLSILLAILSLAQLVEIPVDLGTPHDARNRLLAYVTGDLMYLLPDKTGELTLAESTRLSSAGDVALSDLPKSAVLGCYSDGTRLRIERFASRNAARQMMSRYAESVYDDAYFGPDAAVRTGRGSAHSNHVEVARQVLRETDDKTVLLLWFRGKDWWNPWSWFNQGGIGISRDLFILEGPPEPVRHLEQVIQTGSEGASPRIVVSPFQFLIALSHLLELGLIWLLCQGIAAIAMQQGQMKLARQAHICRWIYLITASIAWLLPWLLLLVPAADALSLPAVYGFTLVLQLAAMALVFLLLLRAARLPVTSGQVRPGGIA